MEILFPKKIYFPPNKLNSLEQYKSKSLNSFALPFKHTGIDDEQTSSEQYLADVLKNLDSISNP